MRSTIPFRPRPTPPPSVARRAWAGPPVLLRLPVAPVPSKTAVFASGDAALIVRRWSIEGARACTLCRSGCNATVRGEDLATCNVWAPAGLDPARAPGFRCDHPGRHYVEPPAVEYAKPGRDAPRGGGR